MPATFRDRESTAPAGYNRFLVPPAALALHLAIGQAGTMNVGAIHGRLLTAWSVAGVLGPVVGIPLLWAVSTTLQNALKLFA